MLRKITFDLFVALRSGQLFHGFSSMQNTTFELRCATCGKKLRCAAKLAGKQRPCPSCGAIVSIPAAPNDDELVPSQLVSPADQNEALSQWSYSEVVDPFDDSIIRSVETGNATSHSPYQAYLRCTCMIRRCSVRHEVAIEFDKKVFSVRDALTPARIRLGSSKCLDINITANDTGTACFFSHPWLIARSLHDVDSLLVGLNLLRVGMQSYNLDVTGFTQMHQYLLREIVDADLSGLESFNQDVVAHVLLIGPRNLEFYISVFLQHRILTEDDVPKAKRKSTRFFAAAQCFAERMHTAEIFGALANGKMNVPLHLAVHGSLPDHLHQQYGALTFMISSSYQRSYPDRPNSRFLKLESFRLHPNVSIVTRVKNHFPAFNSLPVRLNPFGRTSNRCAKLGGPHWFLGYRRWSAHCCILDVCHLKASAVRF
jgi:hypothetical protein